MPQSLSRVLVHIVYSTKDRRPWLQSEKIRTELYKYKATILRDKVDSPALIIGGFADHIHALCLLSRKFAIMDVIEKSKTETTKWIKKQGPEYAEFHWQSGYGIFSVNRIAKKSRRTLPTSLTITGKYHSRMNSARCASDTESRLMNDTCGIDFA